MLKAVKYKFSEVPQQYWDFVHKHGTIYQSKPYLDCLVASGKELVIIGVFEDDEPIGGAGVTLGRKILNFPINTKTYFGPVVQDTQKAASVLKCIADAIKTMSLRFSVIVLPEHAEVFAESPELSNWHKREIEFIHWDISGQMETFWKNLPKGKKAAVNRAKREGVIIQEIKTKEQVSQFYKLYSMSMVRGGLTPEPLVYCENLIEMLRPQDLAGGFLALHPQTKQPIATVMLLLGRDGIATYLQVGHDYEYRNLGATDFLMWRCLEYLKSKGVTIFDLVGLPKGDSARAKGIRHFKTAWAGVNDHRYPSFVLTRGNFGLNPQLVGKVSVFSRKVIELISSCFGSKP